MDRPPDSANPENFIIGQAKCYDNLRVAVPTSTETEFRLDPGPMPILSMIVKPLLVIAFVVGSLWICMAIRAPGDIPLFAYVVATVVGLFNCVMFTVLPYFRFTHERRRGSWLIFDKATRRLHLPRLQQTFDFSDIYYLQYITTKKLKSQSKDDPKRLTELNLVTRKNGEQKRWQLLTSSSTSDKFFDHLLWPLIHETRIPVMRLEDTRDGWDVTVEPYGESPQG